MNRDETIVIMGILQTAYPQFYKGMHPTQAENTVALWNEMFADDPVEAVTVAVKSFIATDSKGFPPHIGIIKEHVLKVAVPQQKSELEAWGQVKKALGKSLYNSGEGAEIEFHKLDPAIQRVVGSPSQLREWAVYDCERLDSVIGSNFQRSYKAVAKQYREQQALPAAISDIVQSVAGRLEATTGDRTEPVALPENITIEVDAVKQNIANMPKRETEKPLTQEEFDKKKAAILASLAGNGGECS